MSGTTPFLSLYKPGGGSTGLILPDEVVDIDRLNANADLIDAFAASWGPASSRNHQFYGPASQLGSVSGMKLGDTYQESDSNKILWRFDGSNWVTVEGGIYLIRPTSLVNATQDPDGWISIAAQSTFALDGIFSARYRHTHIEIITTSASADFTLQLVFRTGGTPAASGYFSSFIDWVPGSGPTRTDQLNTAFMNTGRVSTSGGVTEMEIYDAFQTNSSRVIHRTIDSATTSRNGGGGHDAVSRNGIGIATGGPTVTGKLRVYGYA